MNKIIYLSDPSVPSGFHRSGALPPETRCQIQVDTETAFGNYTVLDAAKVIEDGYRNRCHLGRTGQVLRDLYYIVPASVPAISEERLAELQEITDKMGEVIEKSVHKVHKSAPTLTCAAPDCTEVFARTRGRYPQRFCAAHRKEKHERETEEIHLG